MNTKLAALLAVPLLVAGLAACSSPTSSTNAADSKASKTTGQDWDVAHAKCMRTAGFDVKDPGSAGSGVVTIDGDRNAFQESEKKCAAEVEKALGKRPVSDEEKKARSEWEEASAKEADCLRKLGYEVAEGTSGSTEGVQDIPESAFQKCGAAAPQMPAGTSK